MSTPRGYNPITWDCEKEGCFNKKKRPKIEVFAECFPGSIGVGDVDGIVEIRGNALLLEWKPINGHLKQSQEILFEQLTRSSPITGVVIYGNAETMFITEFQLCIGGKWMQTVRGPLIELKQILRDWARWARRNPAANYQGILFPIKSTT